MPIAAQDWSVFRKADDNAARTSAIHSLSSSGIDASVVLARLRVESDVSARRALVLSLGGFTPAQISAETERGIIELLLRWYREDGDAGLHSAIDWLLRHHQQGVTARAHNWGQSAALAAVDREFAGREAGTRGWNVSREGHTMTIVRGPVEFKMGAVPSELPRRPASDSAEEPLHYVRIPRAFGIATKEVTIAQFRRFLEANPDVKHRHTYPDAPARMGEVLSTFSPEDGGPQIAVTWYEAAMYCNWLSQQDGLPESEWVYPTRFDAITSGMALSPNYLRRRGYRLPTETEWEFATRAGSSTPRFFGSGEAYLDQYAWYSKNPPRSRADKPDPSDPKRTWPVGQLKPNDLGLFDVYGNVWEWTQDRMRPLGGSTGTRVDDEDTMLVIMDATPRVRRGGGFSYEAAMMRSAHRGPTTAVPTNRRDNVGFRVARTY